MLFCYLCFIVIVIIGGSSDIVGCTSSKFDLGICVSLKKIYIHYYFGLFVIRIGQH